MAAARVVFHPGASEDYAAAFAWYYARGTALASDFEREIDRGIHTALAEAGKFLDWQKYRLGRLQSEMRTEFKKSAIESKA